MQFLVIANCRNMPLLQFTISRKAIQFLKKNYTISSDRDLHKYATFCNSRSQEKLRNFSRKTIQYLVSAICRNMPPSTIHDLKKNFTISQEKLYNFSRKTIQFLVIANCRNKPLSAIHELQKLSVKPVFAWDGNTKGL